MDAQNEIRGRLNQAKTLDTQSRVQALFDEDLADSETIDEFANAIRELMIKRAGLRAFLADQGRVLIGKGDIQHGTRYFALSSSPEASRRRPWTCPVRPSSGPRKKWPNVSCEVISERPA
jgi:hypothetical protein